MKEDQEATTPAPDLPRRATDPGDAETRLPPVGATRWVPRRKAEVVAAVRSGAISLGEACERYTLSVDEFLSWQRALEDTGISGLRATRKRDPNDVADDVDGPGS